MWQAIIAGGALGLMSSFHCVGMCGPLALSLPIQHLPAPQRYLALLLYNSGRIITYTLLGLLLGLAGRQLFISGGQQWLSIVLGVLILIVALNYYLFKNLWEPRWMQSFHYKIQGWMGQLLQSASLTSFLFLGMANGLLPCGMVYIAVAGALSTASLTESVGFMMSFGLATLPAMLLLSLAGMHINLSVRRSIKKVMPLMVAFVAVLLILRGLNLGIPFISPVLPQSAGTAAHCH